MASLALFFVAAIGCDRESVRIAREAADRQAEQNRELARLDREHAAARKECDSPVLSNHGVASLSYAVASAK